MIGENGRHAAAHRSVIDLVAPLTKRHVCGDPWPRIRNRASMPKFGGCRATIADVAWATACLPLSVNNVVGKATNTLNVSLGDVKFVHVGVSINYVGQGG